MELAFKRYNTAMKYGIKKVTVIKKWARIKLL